MFQLKARTESESTHIEFIFGFFPVLVPDSSTEQFSCFRNSVQGNQSVTCNINAGAEETILEVEFYSDKNNNNVSVTGSTEGGGGVEECEPDTNESVSTNDWRHTILDTNDTSSVVECALDAGAHGINNDSLNKFAKDCPFGDTCNSPNYTSSFNSKLNFSRPSELYVPANFHDFLQGGGEAVDPSLFPEENAHNYCNSNSHADNIFRDSFSGIVFQCKQKLQVMKDAIGGLLDSLSTAPINIGLERFNKSSGDDEGGTIINAVQSISTNKTAFEAALNGLNADGATPLQESMWEAYLYYAGLPREHGFNSTTDPSAKSGNNYTSPITDACQSNNVILLSDGEPTDDESNRSDIQQLSDDSCGTSDGACLNELTGALNRLDMNTNVSGTNSVRTYTIGFALDIDVLEDAANDGGGQYFTADDTTELQLAFQNIILDILTDSSTFVAPAVSVNAFNELQHRNEIYYALFEPAGTPRWPGNVKKYSVDSEGTVLDANTTEAVEFATGFFKETAQSIWSDEVDGRTVTLGGAAEQLSSTRTVFTPNDAGNLIQLQPSNFNEVSVTSLTASGALERDDILSWVTGVDVFDDDGDNNVTEANNFIADPLHSRPFVVTYGGSAAQPEDVLFFTTNLGTLHAVDPDTDNGTELWSYLVDEHKDNLRSYIQAPNSTAHVYGLDGDMTVVTTEAEGSNSDNFNLDTVRLYFGERRGGSRYYAIDASNARIAASPSKQPDESYSTPFKSLWKITGAVRDGSDLGTNILSGVGADIGFRDLGQTWSRMIPTKLKHAGTETEVLIFSGGYDPRHDEITHQASLEAPDYGNAIYIIDALSGELLYSIGNNNDADPANVASPRILDQHDLNLNMINSIPASPTVVDIDGDGNIDSLFTVDIIGHVWRIDFNQSKELDGTGRDAYATGGLIADLSEVDSESGDVRRFYNSLDASRSNAASGSDHINIVVGSGYRASPSTIENITNKLYILFDKFPRARSLDTADEDDRYAYFEDEAVDITQGQPIPDDRFRVVTAADLGESSFDDGDENTTDDIKSIFNSPNGIFVNYTANGEKVLQRSTTFNGVVVVSTFNPDGGGSSGACGGNLGSGRVYVLDINTGLSVLKEFENGTVVIEDGEPVIADFYQLQHQGIPAETTNLLLPSLAVCIGTECNIDPIEEAMLNGFNTGQAYRTFWREN